MTDLSVYLNECGSDKDLITLISAMTGKIDKVRAAFPENQLYKESINASGEIQAGMDIWADKYFTKIMGETGLVKEVASEEQDEITRFKDATGNYAVVMDPLDGSSLISTNLAVGTIVGIYGGGSVMKKGRDLKAAFYILYGPMDVLVISVGKGVRSFIFDETTKKYVHFKDNIQIPEGKIYGTGGVMKDWTETHKKVISYFNEDNFKIRYSGSYVADCHQILTYGGIYTYPALQKKPEGKLRLLFEANPLGFIISQAGGAITDGNRNILDIEPTSVHQRIPIYIGSRSTIKKINEIFSE